MRVRGQQRWRRRAEGSGARGGGDEGEMMGVRERVVSQRAAAAGRGRRRAFSCAGPATSDPPCPLCLRNEPACRPNIRDAGC